MRCVERGVEVLYLQELLAETLGSARRGPSVTRPRRSTRLRSGRRSAGERARNGSTSLDSAELAELR